MIPFGLRTQVGLGNHVLDRGPDPSMGMDNFEGGRGVAVVKYRDTVWSSVQKQMNHSR